MLNFKLYFYRCKSNAQAGKRRSDSAGRQIEWFEGHFVFLNVFVFIASELWKR
jgi:hypothetical protein